MVPTAPVEPVFLWRARTCSIAADLIFCGEVIEVVNGLEAVNGLEVVIGMVRNFLDWMRRRLYNFGGGGYWWGIG